jgi:hypothetical protein
MLIAGASMSCPKRRCITTSPARASPHQTPTKAADEVETNPAMAAGAADHVWTLSEIARLLDSN